MKKRREYERAPLSTSCESRFVHNQVERVALMIDLSPKGAGFLIHRTEPIGLEVGDVLTFRILTPIGRSECTGVVKWIGFVTAGLRFGVEFTELRPDDPLLDYADAPF